MRIVRKSLERPDEITASAVSAREQVAQAVVDKIRELDSGKDLKRVADHVLPQFQKFLESPEEKRLRRIRAGVITGMVGLGVTVINFLMALITGKEDFLPFIGPGFILFLVGLGIVVNGLMFTIPKKRLPGNANDALAQNLLDATAPQYQAPQLRATTNDLSVTSKTAVPSVTEHTTHHLHSKK